jgi:predicted phosphodiesterase
MRLAVISDVHSNIEALEAVLEDMHKRGITKRNILFLGDAVGYGPNPNECTSIVKKSASVLIAGNHDWGALGLTDINYFNPNARAAIKWTDEALTPENRLILEEFSLVKRMKKDSLFLVHGTPKEPEGWHYLLSLWDAEVNFGQFEERICLLGHSHLPFVMEKLPSGEIVVLKDKAELSSEHRYIINPGSVGQPRDGNPRASYAILTDEAVEIIRIEYDFPKTQGKMRKAGLPAPLIERLSRGI